MATVLTVLCLAALAAQVMLARHVARSRGAHLAALDARSAERAVSLQRLDTMMEILTAMRAEDATPPAPESCGCDVCHERDVAADVLAAAGPLAHRIVVARPGAAPMHVGFPAIRWGQA